MRPAEVFKGGCSCVSAGSAPRRALSPDRRPLFGELSSQRAAELSLTHSSQLGCLLASSITRGVILGGIKEAFGTFFLFFFFFPPAAGGD